MSHYSPFTALRPLSWEKDLSSRDPSSLDELLTSTLASAELLIESLPTPTPPPPLSTAGAGKGGGRARSHTDSDVGHHPQSPTSARPAKARDEKETEIIKKLQKEWKDLKIPQGGSNNPHNISMFKMSAKDGKYAWFARRSLHRSEGPFELWEAALRREMGETLARVEREPGREPGTGNIRGIGGERRIWGWEGEAGQLDLYQVSARFPGPTTPRDFVTLLMMPKEKGDRKGDDGKRRPPRKFIIVSRPCDHPDCPPRSGFIRGTYESVELIREVPVEKQIRRARSSINLSRDEMKDGAERAAGHGFESEGEGRARLSKDGDGTDTEVAIEWLMVTRSDPGGSVPKFMVEKGTPGGVINDAGKFLKWLSSQTIEDLTKPLRAQEGGVETKPTGKSPIKEKPGQAPATASVQDQLADGKTGGHHEEAPPPGTGGIYGMLTSALSAATSAVTSRVAAFAPSSKATDSDMSDDESDTTSEASFASAEEGNPSPPDASLPTNAKDTSNVETDGASTISEVTTSQPLSREPTPSTGFSQAQSRHEKELRKLQQRMRKAEEKLERRRAKHKTASTDTDNNTTAAKEKEAEISKEEDQALAKLHEKHQREIARQEEKYRRELERLAQKRAAEERKAEQRRRKQAEREERANLAMELERVKAERDVARKEVEMLRERVGELQGQNTRLVARLGREGIKVDDVAELGAGGKEKGEGGKGGK
ncbi:hypothetical protein C8A03DRAFT_13993 [Achaetomium macrosporum]|uniref:DUF3074 domain-containing protein n=1 Tax=Achaetomium macrosporum TaxID=79813 RepID=A0AAN7HGK7_9PEZI|nr:hypothetical protein C8A03DRAFT_13993 [Achaetomium macrosporum]